MNFPGKLGNNWGWRMTADDLTDGLKERLGELNFLYYR